MSTSPNLLFCFGLGYSALAFARALQESGWQVAGTCRGPGKQAARARLGLPGPLVDRTRPLADPAAFGRAAAILSAVPPDERGDPVLDLYGADPARAGDPRWLGYLSTTGVYGDRQGGWVDE